MALITLQEALDYNLYTVLNNRVLFFDGDTVISPENIVDFATASNTYVSNLTREIEEYNKFVQPEHKLKTKETFRQTSPSWNIPSDFLNLDVEQYVYDQFVLKESNLPREQITKRIERIHDELEAFTALNMIPILRVIIYVINTLTDRGIVWGVGRGSCVSSYVLYLVGVHDVDSVQYGLNYTDFLRIPDTQNGDYNG